MYRKTIFGFVKIILTLFTFMQCKNSFESVDWILVREVKFQSAFDGWNRFYVINDSICVVLRWGVNSRACIYHMNSGEVIHEISVPVDDYVELERTLNDKIINCKVVPYTADDDERHVFEVMFIDSHTKKMYLGWYLIISIEEDGYVEDDFVAVLSLLKADYSLAEHKLILPANRDYKEGYLDISYLLRFGNEIWKDTIYLFQNFRQLKENTAFYEKRAIATLDKPGQMSAYKVGSDDDWFWHGIVMPHDMPISYSMGFANDGKDLLWNVGRNRDPYLYYYDRRDVKYSLETEPFNVLWSFEKHMNRLNITAQYRIDGRSFFACQVIDTTGHRLSTMNFYNEDDESDKRKVIHAKAHHGKFYVVHKLQNDYFLEVYEYR